MNSTNYITPFWVQDNSGSSWTLYLYARNSGSGHGDLDWTIDVEYSTDLLTWSDFGTTPTTRNSSISKSFSANQRVYLRSKTQCTHWGKYDVSNSRYWHIQILSSQQYSVGGNIMSLIYGSTFADNRKYVTFPDDTLMGIFHGLFNSGGSNYNTYLVDAGELVLPVTHSTSTLPPEGEPNSSPLNRVYRAMFERCSALVNGPHIDLRARGITDLAYCFQRIFAYCSSMKSVHCNTQAGNYRFNDILANGGGASGSVFYDYSGGPASSEVPTARMEYRHLYSMYLPTYDRVVDWHSSVSGRVHQVTDNQNKVIYLNEDATPVDYSEPFYVENITSSAETLNIKKDTSDAPTLTIEYSTDKTTWTSFENPTSTTALTYTLQPGNKVYLRCNTDGWSALNTGDHNIITGVSKVGGNIMSLIYGNNFNGTETSFPTSRDRQFLSLFEQSSTLQDASKLLLPCKVLTEGCYTYMFNSCTSLTSAPKILPATTLANRCYANMFQNCTSLTSAPELPATTLADYCYNAMFWLCTSLTSAPELPATTLDDRCYNSMFQACSSLNNVKCLATDISAFSCTYRWLIGTSSVGTFYCKDYSIWSRDESGIPTGWAVLEV